MTGRTDLKAIGVMLGVIGLFCILAARLWELQLVRGQRYSRQSYENRLRIERVPAPRGIIFDRTGKPLVKNAPFYSVAILPEMAQSADLESIATFLSMDQAELAETLDENRNSIEPVRIKGALTFEEVAFIETRLSDYPALTIDVDETREYPFGEMAAHVLGYLGKMNPGQIEKANFKSVPRESFIGQWGVEKMFDTHLRGAPGQKVYEVDALGRRVRLLREERPVQGEDLYLSLDFDLQRRAEELLQGHVGALVALRPDTGEVLALVSRPSFDPNLFSRGINYNDWLALTSHKGYPMLNRALQSQYPPGSTFKIISAIAALEEHTLTPQTQFNCQGYISKGQWTFRCWKHGGHGTVDLHRSLVESCDVYYYNLGEITGIDVIARTARQFHLGQEAGVGLVKERTGLIPDTEWKRRTRKESWYLGETFNAAIGQGFVLTTPVQLARMTAMVANGGYDIEPGLTLVTAKDTPLHERLPVSDKTIKLIKKALTGVVNEESGTGKRAHSDLTTVAGKTGTAQVIALARDDEEQRETTEYRFRDHAWFVAFAPAEKPEIALAILVEHGGGGGSTAAPIAREAIEAYIESLIKQKEHVRVEG